MAYLDNGGIGNYVDYRNNYSYDYKPGVLLLPCSDGPPVSSVVFQAYSTVTQTFAGVKKGTPPLLPAPAANETVLSSTLSLPLGIPGQSGEGSGFTYAAAGQFTVLQSSPSTPSTGYNYPSWPFRLEPMTTLAETSPYVSGSSSFNLQGGTAPWNQSGLLASLFFSTDI